MHVRVLTIVLAYLFIYLISISYSSTLENKNKKHKNYNKTTVKTNLYTVWQYIHVYSHFMSFIIWCLTQCGVGDCGQPQSVFHQDQHTEHSTMNTRHWTLSLPPSLEYNIRKYVRINTISSISTGRWFSFCKEIHHNTLQLILLKCFLSDQHQRDWDNQLLFAMAAYRASRHEDKL